MALPELSEISSVFQVSENVPTKVAIKGIDAGLEFEGFRRIIEAINQGQGDKIYGLELVATSDSDPDDIALVLLPSDDERDGRLAGKSQLGLPHYTIVDILKDIEQSQNPQLLRTWVKTLSQNILIALMADPDVQPLEANDQNKLDERLGRLVFNTELADEFAQIKMG